MKTKVLILLACIFTIPVANSQTMYGVRAGINFDNVSISGTGLPSTKSITGFNAGLIAERLLSNDFYFDYALLYSLKGAKSDVAVSEKLKLHYLEVPLNIAYKYVIRDETKIFVKAGPYLAYALSGKLGDTDVFSGTDKWKRFDWGLDFGVGLDYKMVQLALDYELGLDNYGPSGSTIKNRVFEISLAYMFGPKK